jgi:hypothetical protein
MSALLPAAGIRKYSKSFAFIYARVCKRENEIPRLNNREKG